MVHIYCKSADVLPAEAIAPFLDARLTVAVDAGADLAECVRATLFVLSVSRPRKSRDRLRAHLEQARQLFTVTRAGPPGIPDAVSVEAFIAMSRDGVIEVPRDGRSDIFLDAKLRRFHHL